MDSTSIETSDSSLMLAKLGFIKERIAIRERWFDVINLSELYRKRNKLDGYYRVIYIQINFTSGEYYIGKANRSKWSELKRYHGSGTKFVSKFKKNQNQFTRFYIASCGTAEETELLEASIVTSEILADEHCLNLVVGGAGTSNRPSIAESSQKKREYMINHPEQFKAMLQGSKEAFQSGKTPKLQARNERIKEVMSAEKYRDMSRKRINTWKKENPEAYAEARRKNRENLKSPETKAKREASRKQWAQNNPEEYKVWQDKLIKARTSQRANKKRKASLEDWREKNPLLAYANAQKRARAAGEKRSKPVSMMDLDSGKIVRQFTSQQEAAKWLVETGKAKNLNCVSSISSVCLRRPCTNGGYRKKAYGYSWRFTDEL